MLFFFKEKPLEIVFKISEDYLDVQKFIPAAPAKNFIPKWWKKLPSSKFAWEYDDGSFYGLGKLTTKSCPGIISSLTTGAIIPLWTDLAVRMKGEDIQTSVADRITLLDIHPPHQTEDFYSNYWHMKIGSPWMTATSVPVLYTFPFWLFPQPMPFATPYGIVHPVNGHAASNFFMFFKKTPEVQDYLYKAGTPLIHVIPLTDKKVTYKTEVITPHEYKKIATGSQPILHFAKNGLIAMRKSLP